MGGCYPLVSHHKRFSLDNLKFDLEGIKEVQRKFFGTLYNTYQFFALYSNVDGFAFKEAYMPLEERPEIDRWILSSLNSMIRKVEEYMNDYEPTQAGRVMEEFVDEHLSNWYVRLCRRRFWKGEYEQDKICAYQTLYECPGNAGQTDGAYLAILQRYAVQKSECGNRPEPEQSVHHVLFPRLTWEPLTALRGANEAGAGHFVTRFVAP